jgi:hypothetical protein
VEDPCLVGPPPSPRRCVGSDPTPRDIDIEEIFMVTREPRICVGSDSTPGSWRASSRIKIHSLPWPAPRNPLSLIPDDEIPRGRPYVKATCVSCHEKRVECDQNEAFTSGSLYKNRLE